MKKLLLLLLLPLWTIAQIPQQKSNSYVNDYTGLLSQDQITNLNNHARNIEKASSVEIAIVLINELPTDMAIEDYSRELGKKWGVGNAGNGLVYVAAINQRKQRLEVGSKLEGDIPDIEALAIIDRVKPFFRQQAYYPGLEAMLDGVWTKVDPVAKQQQALLSARKEREHQESLDTLSTVAAWAVSILLALGAIFFFFLRPVYKQRKEERRLKQEVEEAIAAKHRERRQAAMMESDRLYREAEKQRIIREGIERDAAREQAAILRANNYAAAGRTVTKAQVINEMIEEERQAKEKLEREQKEKEAKRKKEREEEDERRRRDDNSSALGFGAGYGLGSSSSSSDSSSSSSDSFGGDSSFGGGGSNSDW